MNANIEPINSSTLQIGETRFVLKKGKITRSQLITLRTILLDTTPSLQEFFPLEYQELEVSGTINEILDAASYITSTWFAKLRNDMR